LAMQVDAARVGAGTESPGKAIKDIKKDKENIDKGKLKKASDIVEVDEVKANKLMADRTKAMDDQRKMRKIEATAKSPAVKSAAKSMARKEGDKQLLELQKLQAVRDKEDKDRAKKRKAAASMDEDAAKLKKLVQSLKDKMEVQKHTTKKIMDYEGQKFKRAVQSRMKARIEEAKALLQLQKAQKRVKTVTTVRGEETQKSKIAKAKRNLFFQTQHKQKATMIANAAETAEHRAALALKAKLAQGMEKIIAAKLPTRTEQQQKADGKLQAADVMLKTQKEFIEAAKGEVANLNARLANQQSKRIDLEKQAKNVDRQVKAVKKRPVPELPKGIKAPASIAAAKAKTLKRKKAMLLTDAKATERAEVKTALAIEVAKRDVEKKTLEAKRLATVSKELQRQKDKIDQQATKAKFGVEAVRAKAKREKSRMDALNAQNKIEDDIRRAKRKEEDAALAAKRVNNAAEASVPAATNSKTDRQIAKEKAAVAAVQNKLRTLSKKIGAATIESAEAPVKPKRR